MKGHKKEYFDVKFNGDPLMNMDWLVTVDENSTGAPKMQN